MRVMSQEAIDRTHELDAWGLGLVRLESGLYHQKASASHRYDRLLHCGKLMGKPLMSSLRKKMTAWEIESSDHVMFVDLMKEGERVVGAWGFRYRDGTPVAVHARATIIATGGAPQLHEINDSPPYVSGDGYAMALRAGAELIDMEFIDYQLLAAAPERIKGYPPHTSGFINAGAYLYNKDGERFMWRYDPERGERATRAIVNRAVGTEIYEGRGTESHGVLLDARHVFDAVNDGATADIVRVFRNCGVDMAESPIEVASGPHTYLGGIRIDEWGRSSVVGLYSEGGGWKEGFERFEERASREGAGDVDEIRRGVQRVGALTIGQIRDGDRLEHALGELGDLERENENALIAGEKPRQRWECMRKIYETGNLIQVARMLATAALERKESRGGHFRFDYSDLDNGNWKYNIILRLEGGRILPRREEVPGEEAAEAPPGAASTAAMP